MTNNGDAKKRERAVTINDVLARLRNSVTAITMEYGADATNFLKNESRFFNYLKKSQLDEKTRDEAWSLYIAIAKKQREIILAEREKELARQNEKLKRNLLYVLEILVFLVSASLAVFGLFSKIDVWRLLACAGILNLSLFPLLYFHVGEYNRVDKHLKRMNPFGRRGLTAAEKVAFLEADFVRPPKKR